MVKYLKTANKLKGSDTSRVRICVAPLGKPPGPTEMLEEGKEGWKGDGGEMMVSVTAMGPTAAAGTTLNLSNTSFSSVVKAIMGYGDLGDEMNLSLIHSLTCAKYSIIKVIHILYDLTFPDISSLQISHTVLVERKKKNLGFLSAQIQEVIFYQIALPKCSR